MCLASKAGIGGFALVLGPLYSPLGLAADFFIFLFFIFGRGVVFSSDSGLN